MNRRTALGVGLALLTGRAAGQAAPIGGMPAPPAVPTAPASLAAPRPPLSELLPTLDLVRLDGTPLTWAPEAARSHALRLQALVQTALNHADAELGLKIELQLAVLDAPRWRAAVQGPPYGLPAVLGRPPVVVMPADDMGVAALDAVAIGPQVPASVQQALKRTGLDWDSAARRYVDLVGLHEVGHVVLRGLGLRPRSRWLDEMLATYFAWDVMRTRLPEQAAVWDAVLAGYRDGVQPRHRALAEFDRLYAGVGPQNYVWYQAQFQQMVAELQPVQGAALLKRLAPLLASTEPGLEPAAQLIERLAPMLPGLGAWAQRLAGAPAA